MKGRSFGALILLKTHPMTFKIIITLLFWFFITACEQPFEPVQENERHFFSINGYLDASADTQWVRVMPVRETLLQEPDLPVPLVTLYDLENDTNVVMRDSLFTFSGGRYAYNFWTTMDLQPEQKYRLVVEGQDGRFSQAEVTLPPDFPEPRFREPEFGDDILLVEGVERLADIQVVYEIRLNNTGEVFSAAFSYLPFSIFLPPSTYRIGINPDYPRTEVMNAYCGITTLERNIFVAAGGPEWHDFLSIDKHTIALPDGITNIENGVGYLGGILSKTFPYVDIEGNRGLFHFPCPS